MNILQFVMPECSLLKLALECFNRVTCGDGHTRVFPASCIRVQALSGIHKCFRFPLKTCGNDSFVFSLGCMCAEYKLMTPNSYPNFTSGTFLSSRDSSSKYSFFLKPYIFATTLLGTVSILVLRS